MDPRIRNLKSTTFFGRRFTRRQIAQIQQTVDTFPALSRTELAQTICEHLNWQTLAGKNRVASCLGLLEALEQEGILTLPPQPAEPARWPAVTTGSAGPRAPTRSIWTWW